MTIVYRAPGFIACSVADCDGEGVVNGRTYRWEFSAMFGPLFVGSTGEPLKHQPGPRSNAWRAFETWHRELCAEETVMRFAREDG